MHDRERAFEMYVCVVAVCSTREERFACAVAVRFTFFNLLLRFVGRARERKRRFKCVLLRFVRRERKRFECVVAVRSTKEKSVPALVCLSWW